jgi:3-mercaptopropionate dioxygenase
MSMLTTTLSPSQLEALVLPIARAVKDDRVTSLAATLVRMQAVGAFGPELFLPPRSERYARNLIHRDPDGRFVVIAMTWGPGQGSPLHDHSGSWGAEIVVNGIMSETMYELTDRDPEDRYQFMRGPRRTSEPGTVSVLIPPLEYHDFGNAGDGIARTLHVYGEDLTSSQAFTQEGDGWWRSRRVELPYDA